VLTWTGPMELRPLEAPANGEQTGRRFDAIATGKQVRIKDSQGEAVCTRMIYRNETRAVWLTGSEQLPGTITSSTGRRMVAPEIALERDARRAFLRGPGSLSDPGRGAELAGLLVGPQRGGSSQSGGANAGRGDE